MTISSISHFLMMKMYSIYSQCTHFASTHFAKLALFAKGFRHSENLRKGPDGRPFRKGFSTLRKRPEHFCRNLKVNKFLKQHDLYISLYLFLFVKKDVILDLIFAFPFTSDTISRSGTSKTGASTKLTYSISSLPTSSSTCI